jgi:hypothetical protein
MLAPRPRYIDRRLRSTRAGRASSLPRMIECGLRPLAAFRSDFSNSQTKENYGRPRERRGGLKQ